MMTDQELMQRLQILRNIKPSTEWLSRSEKSLKAVMPKSQWPIYSVIFVLALGLSLSLILNESPEKSIKIIQEQNQIEQKTLTQEQTKTEITKTIKKATKTAKKIEQAIEEKILAVKIETSGKDEINPLVKLSEDLSKAKATRELLEEIEKDIENGDYVIARQKLDKWLKDSSVNLDSLKVDSEKEEIIINQE